MKKTLSQIVICLVIGALTLLNGHQSFVIDDQRAEIRVLKNQCTDRRLAKPVQEQPLNIKDWYDLYNYRYFHHELPGDVNIYYTDVHDHFGNPAMGVMEEYADGRYEIKLDAKYNLAGSTARLTLLHEMAHIQVRLWPVEDFDMHGPLFQMVMHRLANQGAMEDLW